MFKKILYINFDAFSILFIKSEYEDLYDNIYYAKSFGYIQL
ncbi:hypothetical protein LV85_01539 [Algoriphagus chordae]|uniref:Uncharacterized protein n=1 Tax=Algoriphagus chordae TaxID=237019 RepID=A0A2W7RII7_9BACT|nr:hypothetical protein LV85_01539 [Algoriphagus chordae]